MKAHVLQHVPFEGVGSMGPWLASRGAEVSCTRFYEDPSLPDPEAFDLVIAMGGPMSVNDETAHPWLRGEKRFLREAIGRGVAVLGVCLGAQLVASALGSRVYRNPVKEIGWFPVEATPGTAGTFRFPPACSVFHWHGETFDLPPGAVLLARSAACENQAFQLGGNVIGLQFHLETTPRSVRALVEHCSAELVPGAYTQAKAMMLAAPEEAYNVLNRQMDRVLEYLAGSAAAG